MNKLQQAITDLAKLYDGWSLLADTDAAQFIFNVKTELIRLRNIEAKLPMCWGLNDEGVLVQNVPMVPEMELWSPPSPLTGHPEAYLVGHVSRGRVAIQKSRLNYAAPSIKFYDSREAAMVVGVMNDPFMAAARFQARHKAATTGDK